jgi:hypothetical protein
MCGGKDSWQLRLGHAIWNSEWCAFAWIRRFSGVVCGSLSDRAPAVSTVVCSTGFLTSFRVREKEVSRGLLWFVVTTAAGGD